LKRPAVRIFPRAPRSDVSSAFEIGWMMWFARVTSHASVVNGLTLALAFYWPALGNGIPRAATITALTMLPDVDQRAMASSSRRGSSTR
jgi:hypothetical protein